MWHFSSFFLEKLILVKYLMKCFSRPLTRLSAKTEFNFHFDLHQNELDEICEFSAIWRKSQLLVTNKYTEIKTDYQPTAIPCWIHWFSSDHQSWPTLGLGSTWMGDHLGTQGAVKCYLSVYLKFCFWLIFTLICIEIIE